MSKGTSLSTKIALPYAEALLELVQEPESLDQANQGISMIYQVLQQSSELRLFLASPLTHIEAKKQVITQLFSGQISDIVLTFFLVLIDRKRIALANTICERYLELAYLLKATAVARVTTSIELNDQQKEQLIAKLKTMTSMNDIKLEMIIDPALIGGFTVQVGSKIIDMSLLGQLKEISFFLGVKL